MPMSNRSAVALAVASALAAALVAGVVVRWTLPDQPEGSAATRSEHPAAERPAPADRAHRVHERGSMVMPFDLDATTHVFEMTDSGGIQDVVATEPDDTATIRLIRQHLAHEAELFGRGDFRDPMSLHGAAMPGVRDLAAASDRLRVRYVELPDGARIVFSADDVALITAVHRWFGAQLSDHAGDATYR